MKTRLYPALLAVLLGTPSLFAGVVTDFGNSASSFGGWAYNPSTSTISGTEAPGALIYGNTSTTNNFGDIMLNLSGNASTAPAGFFSITLVDQGGDEAVAQYRWSDFLGGATVSRSLTFTTFNFSQVDSWSLDSGGSNQMLGASFSQIALVAIPEPSTWAAVLGSFLFAEIFRRKIGKRRLSPSILHRS